MAVSLKQLQDSKGKFTIAAFDQRGSLAKLLGVNHDTQAGKEALEQIKSVFMESFAPICSAVLVDPDFGFPSLEKKPLDTGLLLSLEQPSYTVEEKEKVPKLNQDWNVAQIVERNAAVKFVLFYHPQSETASEKLRLVQQIYAECKQHNVPFLFEVILHPLKTETEDSFAANHPQLQLQTISDFTATCDVLKLEFPILASETFDETAAADACRNITTATTVPWVILSKGMSYERYIRALDVAMKNGASGFAVGRAVWKEIGELSTFEEQKNFIHSTARERMQRLIQIVDAQ